MKVDYRQPVTPADAPAPKSRRLGAAPHRQPAVPPPRAMEGEDLSLAAAGCMAIVRFYLRRNGARLAGTQATACFEMRSSPSPAPQAPPSTVGRQLAHDVNDPELYWWTAQAADGSLAAPTEGALAGRPLLPAQCGGFPAVVHQTWKTSELPASYREWQGTWQHAMPGARLALWTDETNLELVRRAAPWFEASYLRLPKPIERVDAVRWVYLAAYGGVYADLDFVAVRDLAWPPASRTAGGLVERGGGACTEAAMSSPGEAAGDRVVRSVADGGVRMGPGAGGTGVEEGGQG